MPLKNTKHPKQCWKSLHDLPNLLKLLLLSFTKLSLHVTHVQNYLTEKFPCSQESKKDVIRIAVLSILKPFITMLQVWVYKFSRDLNSWCLNSQLPLAQAACPMKKGVSFSTQFPRGFFLIKTFFSVLLKIIDLHLCINLTYIRWFDLYIL